MAGDRNSEAGRARATWRARLATALLVATMAAGLSVAVPVSPAAAVLRTERVSVAASGAEAQGASHTPAVSADGRYVAFISTAALVAADTNGLPDVYRKDRWSGGVSLVSVAGEGTAGNASSDAEEVAISDDGNVVVFRSSASDLIAGDSNNQEDLFARDMTTGVTQRVNVNSSGTVAGLGPDFFSVSADGTKIAFVSYTSLDANPTGVYVRDTAGSSTRFIHAADGAQVAISGDGSKVAFSWSAPNAHELYLFDDNDPVLYRFNYGTSSNFADPAGLLGPDAMSYDGNVIAFWSDGDSYEGDPNVAKPRAVYAYDHIARKAGGPFAQQIQRLSQAGGVNANANSGGVTNDWPKGAVSADGNLVAFTSKASNLDPNASAGGAMVANRATGGVVARSIATSGGARPVSNTTMSANGQVVAFATAVTDLVANDTNNAEDVFVNDDDAIIGIDLRLTHDDADGIVLTSPRAVPFADIPADPASPRTQSSGIGLIDISSSPIGLIDISSSGIGLIDISSSPIGLIDISSSGIGLIDISSSPIGLIDISSSGIGLIDISSSPIVRDALAGIMLSQLPLRPPLSWPSVLGQDVQTQTTSLLDVLLLNPRPAGLANLAFPGALQDPSSGPLGGLSVYSLLLGTTPLGRFSLPTGAPGWCARLEALGYPSCGASLDDVDAAPRAATNRSLLELQLAGVPFDRDGAQALPVHLSTVGSLQMPAGTPLLGVKLANLRGIQAGFANLAGSALGAVRISAVPAPGAVADCTSGAIDCATATLADAEVAGALLASATFADLGTAADDLVLAQVIHALLPPVDNPFVDATAAQLGILDYDGPGSSLVGYQLRFEASRDLVNGAFEVDVPADSLLVKLSTATVAFDGGEPTPIRATASGQTVRFEMSEVVPAGTVVAIGFDVRPGLRRGTFAMTARALGDGLSRQIDDAAPLTVVNRRVAREFVEDGGAWADAGSVEASTLYPLHVSGPERLFRSLWLEAGDRVDITISDLSVDLDAVLYQPPGTGQSLPLRPPRTDTDPVVPIADEPASLSATGEPLSAEIRDDIEFENLPVAAVSANRGTASERLQALATTTGQYIIQVAPYLQASTDRHFLMSVSVDGAKPAQACSARSFGFDADPHAGADEASAGVAAVDGQSGNLVPASTKTLVLVNQDRINDTYGAAALSDTMAALRRLRDDVGTASDPGTKDFVQAAIVNLDADPAVREAYAAWDTADGVCSPMAANEVVRAINGFVDSVIGASAIEHIMIVGGDEMIPMARLSDLTIDDNERGYAGDLAGTGANNALRAAYANGYLPSDDPYGDFDPQPYAGRWLYVTDVALGRLVETPDQWISAIDRFVQYDGKLEPQTALTTGYDFMADTGAEIDATVEAQLGGPQPDLLTSTWDKAALQAQISPRDASGAPTPSPDLITLNGHFDHRRALPAAGGSLFEPADLASTDLSRRLVLTMGCHSGVSVADVLIGQSTTNVDAVRDWAQAFSQRGAAGYVGQTGYGLGLNGLIALSERILGDYARNLSSQPTSGLALSAAKRAYADQLGVFGVYDEKALSEATFFGIPMYRVQGLSSAPRPAQTGTGTTGFGPSQDAGTGLRAAPLEITNPVISEQTIGGRTALTVGGEALVVEDRPIMPKIVVDAPAGSTGLLLTGLSSVDGATTYRPAFADAVSDLASRSRARTSGDVVFPAAPHALTGSKAVIIPSQFRVTDPVRGAGIRRDFTHMSFEALAPTDPVACTDRRRPRIGAAEGSIIGDAESGYQASIAVAVSDDSPVVEVLVNVLDQSGTWTFTPMAPSTEPGRYTVTVPISGDRAQFGVQAVDACGNVGVTFDKGEFFDLLGPTADPDGFVVDVQGVPSGAAGWLESATVKVAGAPGATFTVTVDGGAPFTYAGPVRVPDVEGVHRIVVRDATGEEKVLDVPIDNVAPTVVFTRPAAGAAYEVGSTVTASYQCVDGGSGVASCQGTVANGGALDTSTIGPKSFSVTTTDQAGHRRTELITYQVVYRFDGFYSPVRNDPTTFNRAKAGSTVPMKWRLYSATGEVKDLAVVRVLRSRTIQCLPGMVLIDVPALELGTAGLKYTDQFHYNWKTDVSWGNGGGQCRNFEVELSDGSVHTARFKFF